MEAAARPNPGWAKMNHQSDALMSRERKAYPATTGRRQVVFLEGDRRHASSTGSSGLFSPATVATPALTIHPDGMPDGTAEHPDSRHTELKIAQDEAKLLRRKLNRRK